MARSNENDSYSLTTTHYLAGRLQTFWIYSAYKIEQREHCRLVLCFTRIQGVLKGATRASPRNRLTLLFYLWRAPSDLNRDTPYDATNSFQDYFLSQLGLDAHLVYCAFKTNTFIFIELTFCPLSTWKTVSTEPLGNQVPMAEIIWLLIADQTDIAFSAIKIICHL